MQIPDAFKPHVASCQRIGTYESPEFELADVLIVHLTESYKLERTRTALRDFVAHWETLRFEKAMKESKIAGCLGPAGGDRVDTFVRHANAWRKWEDLRHGPFSFHWHVGETPTLLEGGDEIRGRIQGTAGSGGARGDGMVDSVFWGGTTLLWCWWKG